MPISYVGQATGTTSATLPTHQANDLIIGFAYRDGSTTAPTIPSGWTTIASGTGGGGSNNSSSLAYIVASGAGTSSGTWTNATGVVFQVYRGALTSSPIGANASQNGSTASVTYPALTLTVTNGSSWVAGFAGHRSVDTNLQNAPTGMTNRATRVDTVCEVAGHDTNGGVSSWSAQSVSVGGTASNWITRVVEIEEAVSTITGDSALSGSGSLSAVGLRSVPGASSLSGVGSLSSTGSRSVPGASSLAGSGSFSSSGVLIRTAEISLQGTGAVNIVDTYVQYGGYKKRITEDGSLRLTQDELYRIIETFSGVIGEASLFGSGSLSATGSFILYSGSNLSGSGSTSIDAIKQLNAASSLTASGSIVTNAQAILDGASVLTGNGFVSASALFVVLASASLSATSSLEASALAIRNASASLNGVALLSVDADVFRVGNIYAKEGGTWKEIIPIVKHNGEWKIPEVVFIKYAGEWKRIYLNGN